MADIDKKISDFINKAQSKIADLAYDIAQLTEKNKDYSEQLDVLTGLLDFVDCLTMDVNAWTDIEKSSHIDFYTELADLEDIPLASFNTYEVTITETFVDPQNYATAAGLAQEIQDRQDGDQNLQDQIDALNQTVDWSTLLPAEFNDNYNASYINVYDDDVRLHTHANKALLDTYTQTEADLADAVAKKHSNANDPSASQKAALAGTQGTPQDSNRYVTDSDPRLTDSRTPVAHTHVIGDITGLQALLDTIPDSGREVELQRNGDNLEWRYVGDISWTDLGSIKGDPGTDGNDGADGEPFIINYMGLASTRFGSAYDIPAVSDGETFLATDTGFIYWRDGNVTSAADAGAWSTGVKFSGDTGWSPVLGVLRESEYVGYHVLLDWIGGKGTKPVLDPPLATNTWYLGPEGFTIYKTQASNIFSVGPRGDRFFPDAQGANLASRDTYDDELRNFVFLDNETGLAYIKLSDASADWSDGYQWKGDVGDPGPPGTGNESRIFSSANTSVDGNGDPIYDSGIHLSGDLFINKQDDNGTEFLEIWELQGTTWTKIEALDGQRIAFLYEAVPGTTLADHETRITALESGAGVSGLLPPIQDIVALIAQDITLASEYPDKVMQNVEDNGLYRLDRDSNHTFAPGDVDDVTNDDITITGHKLKDGDIIQLKNSGGGLPAPLAVATNYWVIYVDANTIQLEASLGGGAIDLTSPGTGTHRVSIVNVDKLVIPDTGSANGTWIKMNSSINAHNNLTEMQGGTTGERYHLTAAEYADVQAIDQVYTAAEKSKLSTIEQRANHTGVQDWATVVDQSRSDLPLPDINQLEQYVVLGAGTINPTVQQIRDTDVYLANIDSGVITINLPTTNLVNGMRFKIVDIKNAPQGTVTIDPGSVWLDIAGSASPYTLNMQGEILELMYDDTTSTPSWKTVNSNLPVVNNFITNTTYMNNLETLANWDTVGGTLDYTGPALLGTKQGMMHVERDGNPSGAGSNPYGLYFYVAVADEVWIRIPRA